MGAPGTQQRRHSEPARSGAGPDFGGPDLFPAALRRDQAGQPLQSLVREHLNTFLAHFEDEHGGRRLPRYVEEEFRALLRCGDPTQGFARLQCNSCHSDLLVPFSCKRRGFCPSCGGRRMAEIATHLIERVLPPAPVRQWVLSLPWHLRFALAGDPDLLRIVARAFTRAVNASYRRRARQQILDQGINAPDVLRSLVPGAVNFVQRFGSSLALNIHFHALYLDGVHLDRGPLESPQFLPAPPLEPEEVTRVNEDAIRRIDRALCASGRPDLVPSLESETEATAADSNDPDDPSASLLPLLCASSVQQRVALGPKAGRPIPRLGDPADRYLAAEDPSRAPSLTANARGFSLHAATRIRPHDRARLEALIRYVARPPLAQGRLHLRDDGKIEWTLRRPWRDGTRAFLFTPLAFLERLAALVPHPREHAWTYHGSLAPASTIRDRIVPRAPTPAASSADGTEETQRKTWAELLERTFAVDVLRCPYCGGRRRRTAVITDPLTCRKILRHIGARCDPLPLAPARPPPQPRFSFA